MAADVLAALPQYLGRARAKRALIHVVRSGPHLVIALVFLPLTACSIRAPAADAPAGGGMQWPAGQEFDDCNGAGWCPRMVVVPAGSFTMGVPADEPGYDEIEGPQRPVSIRRFAAGKFDVTRGQWAEFVSATNRDTRRGCAWNGRSEEKPDPQGAWRDLGFAQDDSHPVVCVSWEEVQEYLLWLSQQTHQHYRLLTEAEWEYSARAGTTTAYPWGASASHEHANYGAEQCCSALASSMRCW